MKLHPKNIVTIFEDPITMKKEEGKARLIRLVSEDDGDGLERWEVRFLDDGYVTERTINVDKVTK